MRIALSCWAAAILFWASNLRAETDWDLELLGPELEELKALDFELALTGFDPRELEDFLADPEDDERANQVPELPLHATTIPGDLWRCGSHRVLCAGRDTNAQSYAGIP